MWPRQGTKGTGLSGPSQPQGCLVTLPHHCHASSFPCFPRCTCVQRSTVLESWVWRKCGSCGKAIQATPMPSLVCRERQVCVCQRQRRRVVFIINNMKKTHRHGSRPALPSVLLGLLPGRSWQTEKGGSLWVANPRQIHLEAPSKALAPPPSPGPVPCKPGPFRSQTHRDAHRQVVTRALGSRGAPGSREEGPQDTVLQEWIRGWRFGGKWTC